MDDVELWNAAFKPMPLHQYFDDAVRLFGGRLAADFMGRSWSYAEYGRLIDETAAGLQAIGVKRGVKVGLCLPNTPFYTIYYFAILKAGGTVVNFNPLYVERELSFQARDAGVEIMVTLDLKVVYDKVEEIRRQGAIDAIIVCKMADILPFTKKILFQLFKGGERATIAKDDAHFLDASLRKPASQFESVEINPEEDVAVLQYTGGTTGVPKGAMLTHRNLSANIEQMKAIFKDADPGREKMLCVLPFFHVFAMTVVQNLSVVLGAQMILLPRFELKSLLKTIARTKPTLFPGVPTIYTAINNAPETRNFDLTSIKICLSGGAPLPAEVKTRFETLTHCVLVEGYGLTETSPVAAVNPLDDQRRAGSIGKAAPGTRIEFRSLEAPEENVPEGEKGELVIAGPQVMKGYWNRPDDTARALINGAVRTGDVGYRDEDGYIYLVDRIKDLILCSGYNVYPRMIEEAIYQHESVEEVIVIGVSDPYRGQAPKAFVKLKPGAELREEELKRFLKGYLSVIERPRDIEFRQELPKTMIGKLSKKELVEEEIAKAC